MNNNDKYNRKLLNLKYQRFGTNVAFNKPHSFTYAVASFFKNYFNITGRSTRADYFWMIPGTIIISLVSLVFFFLALAINTKSAISYYIMYRIFMGIPLFTLQIRRLNDAGFSLTFEIFLYSWLFTILPAIFLPAALGGFLFIFYTVLMFIIDVPTMIVGDFMPSKSGISKIDTL